MRLTDNWFTALATGERGGIVFVSGRKDLEDFRRRGSLRTRIEITWPCTADDGGMPTGADADLIAEVEPLLRKAMEADKLAILTGNYTGDGAKYWVFYCRHLPTFMDRLNDVLEPYPVLPLQIETYEDPEWEEYEDMCSMRAEDEEELE